MKASELISALQIEIGIHGDLEISVLDHNDSYVLAQQVWCCRTFFLKYKEEFVKTIAIA